MSGDIVRSGYRYGRATLRGVLRTAYVRMEVGAFAGLLQRPIFLTLSEPIDIAPDPAADRERYWAHGLTNVAEVHVAPKADQGRYPDFDQYVGSVLEITGDLWPGHTAHHHRPALISCVGPKIFGLLRPLGSTRGNRFKNSEPRVGVKSMKLGTFLPRTM